MTSSTTSARAAAVVMPKKPISSYVTDEPLANIMRNARRKGAEQVWWECWRRRCQLKGSRNGKGKSPLEKDFDAIMHGYEMLQSEIKKRKFYAGRTWQMVRKRGGDVKAVLEKWAFSKKKAPGFTILIEHGEYKLTGEYLVLKYSNEFPPAVVQAAKQGLLDAGVSAEKLQNIA